MKNLKEKIKTFYSSYCEENRLMESEKLKYPCHTSVERFFFAIAVILWLVILLFNLLPVNASATDEVTSSAEVTSSYTSASNISYLGGSSWNFNDTPSVPSGLGEFLDAPGVATYNGADIPFYGLYIGYRYSSTGTLSKANNYICVRNTSGNYSNFYVGSATNDSLVISFDYDRDAVFYTFDLFNSNLIDFCVNNAVMVTEPGTAFLMSSGMYYFTRYRTNSLRDFELDVRIDNQISRLHVYESGFGSNLDGIQYIYLGLSDEILYAYRLVPDGFWESDNPDNIFPVLNITDDFIIYYESVYNSFNSFFRNTYISDGSYDQGYQDGLEHGFMYDFIGGVFNALDVFPITSQFSLFDLISSLIGFMLLLWFLKLLAGG